MSAIELLAFEFAILNHKSVDTSLQLCVRLGPAAADLRGVRRGLLHVTVCSHTFLPAEQPGRQDRDSGVRDRGRAARAQSQQRPLGQHHDQRGAFQWQPVHLL